MAELVNQRVWLLRWEDDDANESIVVFPSQDSARAALRERAMYISEWIVANNPPRGLTGIVVQVDEDHANVQVWDDIKQSWWIEEKEVQ
jgi:hypothetical protein